MHLRKAGSVSVLSKCIESNLKQKVPNIDPRLILAISDCVAASLTTRSVNSYKWINVLPNICKEKSQESRIRRLFKNKKITVIEFMKIFVRELIDILLKKDDTITLIMDQSQILEDRQCLMVSIRFENRALPVLWTIVDTKGAIGFDVQEKVLDQLLEIIPPEVDILLAADRFYETKNFLEWCQKAGWHYRVRLKGNLIFQYEGKNITTKEVGKLPKSKAIEAKFNESNIQTNLGYLHEDGHDEAWIIAMDCDPSRETILDYGQRWGIECMFADLKSRGFSVTETHLRDVERLEKLLLILAIALYCGASVGLAEEVNERYTEKKQDRSKRSFLTKGLATIFSMIVSSTFFHELWAHVPWIT